MSGNVLEWVRDTWSKYARTPRVDPVEVDPSSGDHVARGGSFTNDYKYATTRYRHHGILTEPEELRRLGLRVAFSVDAE